MEIKHESVYRKTAKLKKYQERFMPAITLPCSSNAAWEVVMAVLFLGGRGNVTQYSVFSKDFQIGNVTEWERSFKNFSPFLRYR